MKFDITHSLLSGSVVVRIRNDGICAGGLISDILYLTYEGLRLWDTMSPQKDVDYDLHHRVKVIGVDGV
jgi:hypothetical protein